MRGWHDGPVGSRDQRNMMRGGMMSSKQQRSGDMWHLSGSALFAIDPFMGLQVRMG